jgi:hypothetical protein
MTRTVGAAVACACVLAACGDKATEVSHDTGLVALEVVTGPGPSIVLDSGRVHLDGPTARELSATPGTTVTIDQLQPGSYTISLEGFAGTEVERFGRTTGVEVVAGETTSASVALDLFQPALAPFSPDTSVGPDVTVSFAALPNAVSYEVEVAAEEAFNTVLQTETSATPSTPLTLPGFGDFFIRVRGLDPFDGRGVPSVARPIRIVKPIVTLLTCGFQPGGDLISRGVHIPSFPGSALSQVDLFVSANVAGDYTLELAAFAGGYDGPVIGTSSATVALSGDGFDNLRTAFLFPSPAVVPSSTVAFRITQQAGPAASIFYATGDASPDCSQIVETDDTSPPLSTQRRIGMGMEVQGRAP